jgi:type II secretory ATPase GspE/PulE/Tfp pilus assembly ATPase PilB-like protein
LHEITKLDSGLVLISGATGSGKTTTLYALASEIIKRNKRIISIEDPVESILANVTQIQIDPKRHITFESCLKAVLRQDPDVLIIGEIREAHIAKAALQFAMTGHLVLATIHAGSVTETRARFSYLVENPQYENQIKAVLFQKLLKNQREPGKRVLFMQINEVFDDLAELLEIGILSKEDYTTLKIHEPVHPITSSVQTECLHDSLQ